MKALIIFLKKNQAGAEKRIVIRIPIGNCQNITAGKRKNQNKIKCNKIISKT
jgi:hypothetical protein